MALTHVVAIRNQLADLVVDAFDVGATNAETRTQITKTAGDYTAPEVLVEILLAAPPSFGAAAAGVATANGLPKETASVVTGTAVEFRQVDRAVAEVFRGTVTATAGGGDMEMISTLITTPEPVRITTYTYTASP